MSTILDMKFDRPFQVITPTVDGDVLAVLARAQAEFTVPDLHRMVARWSVDGVRRSLDRLVAQGVVTRRPAGRVGLYSLNRHHLATTAIIALASQFDELVRRLRALIHTWQHAAEFSALFGSAVAGEMRDDSDIDVFVVRPDEVVADDVLWRSQIDQLERDITSWTGNDARTLEFSAQECQRGLLVYERVLLDITRRGVRLTGPESYLDHAERPARDEPSTSNDAVHTFRACGPASEG